MKGEKFLRGMQYIDEKYIEEGEFGTFSRSAFYKASNLEQGSGRTLFRKPLLIAAIIAMAMLLVGCGVAYVIHMQDIKLGDRDVKIYQTKDDYETVPQQVLTFSGLKGSKNFQAAQEWYEFKQGYDPDRALRKASIENPQTLPEEFAFYDDIYTQDMADKLAEIAGKYGLKLAGPHVEARTGKSLFAYLGIDGLLRPDAQAKLEFLEPDYYEGGYLRMDCGIEMEGADGPYSPLCTYYYSPKDCFDDTLCILDDTGDWKEWNYTSASGDMVLLLSSPSSERAWAFCNRENATIALMMWMESGGQRMADRQLEQLVDCFNFTVTPKPGDPALLEGLGDGIDTAAQQQTNDGFTIGVGSVKTDGEKAYITLNVTAPEGTALTDLKTSDTGYSSIQIAPGNWTGILEPKSGEKPEYLSTGYGTREDSDGLDNTQNLLIVADAQTNDGKTFRPGDTWSLYIENLKVTKTSAEEPFRQEEICSAEGIWQFDITFDDSLTQAVEFIGEPVTVSTDKGDSEIPFPDKVTLTSLELRAYSASVTFDGKTGPLNVEDITTGHVEGTEPRFYALLEDGTKIPLSQNGGLGQVHRLSYDIFEPGKEDEPFPLDKITAVVLPDGTKLERVN